MDNLTIDTSPLLLLIINFLCMTFGPDIYVYVNAAHQTKNTFVKSVTYWILLRFKTWRLILHNSYAHNYCYFITLRLQIIKLITKNIKFPASLMDVDTWLHSCCHSIPVRLLTVFTASQGSVAWVPNSSTYQISLTSSSNSYLFHNILGNVACTLGWTSYHFLYRLGPSRMKSISPIGIHDTFKCNFFPTFNWMRQLCPSVPV